MSDAYLLFAVEDPNAEAALAIEAFVAGVNAERAWLCGPLAFVDEVDADSATVPGDAPIRTLGGALALQGPRDDLAAERTRLADVEFLVARLAHLSSSGYAFEIEYDGELIGSVAGGEVDRSITVGFIEPWRERLQAG
jgi:hypothetical protein